MVVAHPCEGRLHCVLSLNYSLRAHAIAVTLPATPLADGKPLVVRTQGVLISKSQGAEQDWHTQMLSIPLNKPQRCMALNWKKKGKKRRKGGSKEEKRAVKE